MNHKATTLGHIPGQSFARRRRVRARLIDWTQVAWALAVLGGFGAAIALALRGPW